MARQRPDLNEQLRRSRLKKYLLADEIPILAQHQHWASFAEPIATAFAGFLIVVTLDYYLAPSGGFVTDVLWWAWFFLVGRAIWKWFLWRLKWLVATDKRLLVNYGLVNQGVAMINLGRVSDLTYTRSTLGQMLGYGTLVRESAPRPRSLHEIRWVKSPHDTYITICAAIFSLQDRMFSLDEDERDGRVEDGPPPPAHRLNPAYANAERPTPPPDAHDERDDEPVEEEPGVIRYGGSQKHDGKQSRQSPDLSQPALREADTGPLPYRRSTTDTSAGWSPTTNDPDA